MSGLCYEGRLFDPTVFHADTTSVRQKELLFSDANYEVLKEVTTDPLEILSY